jgi:hypothetical protein
MPARFKNFVMVETREDSRRASGAPLETLPGRTLAKSSIARASIASRVSLFSGGVFSHRLSLVPIVQRIFRTLIRAGGADSILKQRAPALLG